MNLRRGIALACFALAAYGGALAFGGVGPWVEAWIGTAAFAAAAAIAWDGAPRPSFRSPAIAAAVPLLLLSIWGLVQSAPLPSWALRAVAPATATLKSELVPEDGGAGIPRALLERARREGVVVQEGPAVEPIEGLPSGRTSISVYPDATRSASLSWIAPILFAWVAALVASAAVWRWRLLWTVSLGGGAIVGVGLADRLSGHPVLPWMAAAEAGSAPMGSFVNPNHFGAFATMSALVTLGLVLAILARPEGKLSRHGAKLALTDRAWAVPRLVALGATAAVTLAGLVLSGSRGAWIAFGAGVFALVFARRVRTRVPVLIVAAVLVGIAVGLVAWVGGPERVATRVDAAHRDPSLLMRVEIWAGTWRLASDHLLTGTGLGTFRWAYATYERPGQHLVTDHAHNDYLQVLAEGGLVGAALLAWAVLAFTRRAVVPAMRAGGAEPRWTTAGCVAALFAMLVHSILDFSLQIPANAVLFAALAGIVAAAADDPSPAPSGKGEAS